MRKLLFVVLALGLVGCATTRSQEPAAAKANDKADELVTSASVFIELLNKKDFEGAANSFVDVMKKAFPVTKLEESWNELNTQVGALKQQVGHRTEKVKDFDSVIITCQFEKATVDVRVVFDGEKRINGLFFTPAGAPPTYKPPSYVNTASFREEEVTVGTGDWKLPGTLSWPVGKGPFPAVVLVHGSGPNDRDESIGPNKLFRDLAWGLASQRIAVLRYEKRTKHYGASPKLMASRFTVEDEAVDDALAAVSLLRKTKGIDARKIFVLGHSLGGTLAPRIGQRDKNIAGLVVLAGLVKPLEDAMIEQTIYLISLDGTISREEQDYLDDVKRQAEVIKKLSSADVDAPGMLFQAPPSYWLGLRGYHPPEAAKSLKQRMLILQGERDYQVTMEDYAQWKAVLSRKRGVTFKSYPALNHHFITGTGNSGPEEYTFTAHVAETVVNDIANWIKK